jgi:hypothetical protein
VDHVVVEHDGRSQTVPVHAVVSTIALRNLILGLDPVPMK